MRGTGRRPDRDRRPPPAPGAAGRHRPGPLTLSPGAASAIRRGHPWVYADQISSGLAGLETGDVAVVHDPAGKPIGSAIVDPSSPLAARVWTRDPSVRVDEALVRARVERAITLREQHVEPSTTALRWVHGEGDRAPGIVLDRYGDVAVLRLDGAAMHRWTDRIADVVFELVARRGVRSLALRLTGKGAPIAPSEADEAKSDDGKLRPLRGEPPPETVIVREHGVPFVVDLARGQKTGAFLDQRDNRRRVGLLARGKRVLNLFSYAGGFSLHAALGGATSCTSVDVAAGAHVTAQRSFREAGVELDAHSFVTADVWRFLERAQARGETWDLVISDPPNMAPSEATRARALTAYKQLHGLCAAVVAKGGVLCVASCSSHVSLDDFLGTLDDATLGRDDLRILEIASAGVDHPVLPAFPEGRYLEFVVLG
ncbi:MAG: class I SAM-dependent rRNA methyltransferase [Polyangiales bacterium]